MGNSMHGGRIGMEILLAREQKSKILFPSGEAAREKNFSPLYALFLASDVFLVHSSGNDRTGILSLLCWK